ncbi:MAG TPA: hypothetical protein VFQ77_20660 [Pseudonocardiaceae bacterium]|jgi:hypothetical protein|nr:hypothetical protein [Pseudonocardiaceae bacterium]
MTAISLGMAAGLPALAHGLRPAGGAALDQILIASTAATVLTTALVLLGYGHRTGRIPVLRWLATGTERWPFSAGQPGWVELPSTLGLGSLITALLGMYWDISLHIAQGRDEGPLANPAHYPIMFGLFGVFASGMLAMVLPVGERPGPAALRITRDWYAPVGGVLMACAGFFALLGFPFDDVWHRLFGQDVTLWGPTHLMMIGGAGLSLIGLAVLEQEGRLARRAAGQPDRVTPLGLFVRRGMCMGGLLIGLSVFQGEWDFGVPQFRMVHQPLLIAMAAAGALVAARLWVGRGGTFFAVGFYILVRGGVSVIVGPILGEPFAAIPLYLAEALCVELAALALARRPLALGVVSGLLIGTAGFAAEYAWTQVAFTLPWTPDMLVEGVAMAVAGGVAGGIAGALLALGLQGRLPRPALARPLFAGVLVLLAAGVGNGLLTTVPDGVRAELTLTRVTSPDARDAAQAVVRIIPAAAVDQPAWLTITAWQGGGLQVDHLVPVGDGSYRSTKPMPLSGDWKTLVRLHDGRTMAAVPIYLPADPAIGEPELPAPARFTRDAVNEKQIMQRELKEGVPDWLWNTASTVVLACAVALVLALGWGVARVSRAAAELERDAPRAPVRRSALVGE